MPRIKAVIAAGVHPAEAVKAALGMTIREFAERYGVSESAVSGVIHGSTPYLYARVRDALARHLEVERAYIDEIFPPPRRRVEAARSGSAPEPAPARPGGTAPGASAEPATRAGGAAAAQAEPTAQDPPPASAPNDPAPRAPRASACAGAAGRTADRQDRRGPQEQRAMCAPTTTPARSARPVMAGIAESARDWPRLADPLTPPASGRAAAALAR
jgi:transcriptional regulator with XRE-family HTH domain